MIYLILHFISENPAQGPEIFGILCDLFLLIISIYGIFTFIKNLRR